MYSLMACRASCIVGLVRYLQAKGENLNMQLSSYNAMGVT